MASSIIPDTETVDPGTAVVERALARIQARPPPRLHVCLPETSESAAQHDMERCQDRSPRAPPSGLSPRRRLRALTPTANLSLIMRYHAPTLECVGSAGFEPGTIMLSRSTKPARLHNGLIDTRPRCGSLGRVLLSWYLFRPGRRSGSVSEIGLHCSDRSSCVTRCGRDLDGNVSIDTGNVRGSGDLRGLH